MSKIHFENARELPYTSHRYPIALMEPGTPHRPQMSPPSSSGQPYKMYLNAAAPDPRSQQQQQQHRTMGGSGRDPKRGQSRQKQQLQHLEQQQQGSGGLRDWWGKSAAVNPAPAGASKAPASTEDNLPDGAYTPLLMMEVDANREMVARQESQIIISHASLHPTSSVGFLHLIMLFTSLPPAGKSFPSPQPTSSPWRDRNTRLWGATPAGITQSSSFRRQLPTAARWAHRSTRPPSDPQPLPNSTAVRCLPRPRHPPHSLRTSGAPSALRDDSRQWRKTAEGRRRAPT